LAFQKDGKSPANRISYYSTKLASHLACETSSSAICIGYSIYLHRLLVAHN
jgi:hypothetical protein